MLSCYLRYLPLNPVSVQYLDVQRTAERYAFDMSAWLKYPRDDRSAMVRNPLRRHRRRASKPRLAKRCRTSAWNGTTRCSTTASVSPTRRQVTSPSYEAVAQPIYTRAIGRWKNYEKYLEPALATLEPFVREFGYEP